MALEMIFVADTHSLLWYMSEDARIGKRAKSKFDLAEKGDAFIAIPTIILAETLHIL
jgi:predicted nucleic-acid-binding protein